MAGKETQPQGKKRDVGDKTLEAWGNLNKLTLTAEGLVIAGGLVFGVPWLVALGAGAGVIDLGSDYMRSSMQQDKEAKKLQEHVVYTRKKQLALAA